jgi:hypothetical protein
MHDRTQYHFRKDCSNQATFIVNGWLVGWHLHHYFWHTPLPPSLLGKHPALYHLSGAKIEYLIQQPGSKII